MKDLILRLIKPFTELPTVGIDISDRSLKYVRLTPDREFSEVDIFGEMAIPEGAVINGEIKNADALADVLKELCKKEKKLRRSFAAVSLPEEKSYLRVIQIPRVGKEEIGNAVRWEIESNVPLPLEELIFDYEVVLPSEEQSDHFDIMITAFPKDIVESYAGVFDKAGIGIYSFELESQAIVRSIVLYPALAFKSGVKGGVYPQSGGAVTVLDIGKLRSSIIVFSGRAIVFTTTLGVGGKMFEENIAKDLAVDPEEARRIKIDTGLSKKTGDEKVFDALLPAVTLLTGELRRSMIFYRDHADHLHGAGAEVKGIVLTGGDSNLLGLDTYLASVLRVPVFLGDPLVALRQKSQGGVPSVPRNEAPAFSSAIGLAMRGRN